MTDVSGSGKRVVLYSILCLLIVVLLAGCSSPFARIVRKPRPHGPRPTTQQLVTALQTHFRTVKSFHVMMQVQNPGTPPSDQVQIRSADGDVVLPDKVKAQASVVMSGQAVQVDLISVSNHQYITDPITGQWRVINGVLDPRALTDPDTGLISLVSKVQHISQPLSASLNDTLCWYVSGQLDAKYLAFLGGGNVPAGTMLQANACIGQNDDLPYLLTVTGQASTGDTAQTTRRFELSKFNQNVTISAPQV